MNTKERKTKYKWALVDWNQPTSIIAEQLGVCDQYVSSRRKKFSPESIKKAHIKKEVMKEFASQIDWSKSDLQIAKEIGRNRASVWATRKLLFKE